jgi:hypothetical protein
LHGPGVQDQDSCHAVCVAQRCDAKRSIGLPRRLHQKSEGQRDPITASDMIADDASWLPARRFVILIAVRVASK